MCITKLGAHLQSRETLIFTRGQIHGQYVYLQENMFPPDFFNPLLLLPIFVCLSFVEGHWTMWTDSRCQPCQYTKLAHDGSNGYVLVSWQYCHCSGLHFCHVVAEKQRLSEVCLDDFSYGFYSNISWPISRATASMHACFTFSGHHIWERRC